MNDAGEFIVEQFASRTPEQMWVKTSSGLSVPHEVPRFLFRGECGQFEATQPGIYRPESYRLKSGLRLSKEDCSTLQELIPRLAERLTDPFDYANSPDFAIGLLQHYGLPTWLIDLTSDPVSAFAFAACGNSKVGRICVVPFQACRLTHRLVDLTRHPWAERPQRQEAYGLVLGDELTDLKSGAARMHFGVSWYEFPISSEDRECLSTKHQDLIEIDNDPSAGLLRYHITEYVEKYQKFSPILTDWFLERIPIAPRCLMVRKFEGADVISRLRPLTALPQFAKPFEKERSRLYWSTASQESSWDRMKNWTWPPEGSIATDPRTYHADLAGYSDQPT